MTATVTGAKNQIKNLYNKGLSIFPPKLQDADNKDFFFEQLVDDNNENMIQRKIIGLKPNSVNTRIVLHIIRYITDFIEYVENDKENFSNKHGIESGNLDDILALYKTVDPIWASLRSSMAESPPFLPVYFSFTFWQVPHKPLWPY